MRCWNWSTKRFSQTVRQGCYKGGCCKIAPTKNEIGFPKRGLFTWRFIRGIDDFNEAVLWYFKWFGLHLKKLFTELCPSRNGSACWTNWKLCQNQLGGRHRSGLTESRVLKNAFHGQKTCTVRENYPGCKIARILRHCGGKSMRIASSCWFTQ